MIVRPIDLDREYDTLAQWWSKRELVAPSKVILQGAHGVAVQSGTVDVCVGWMYVAKQGLIGIVEWAVGNPSVVDQFAMGRAIQTLYDFFEHLAHDEGCVVLFTSTQQDGPLVHFLQKHEWKLCESQPHVHLLKVLPKEGE